ncbi:DUF6270 domain-containing protein [Listeria valentina]|uniref:DUF6270 domain-containing protein n=1 Tax=Listeria valentina TaxID=2705293 RepID=UPI0014314272|nr:DUF6270 domain-containing protein [Listeria valentina]
MIIAQKISWDEERKEWRIFVSKNITLDSALIFYKERREFLRPARKFELEVQKVNRGYEIILPLNLVLQHSLTDRETEWRFLCKSGKQDVLLKVDQPLSFEKVSVEDSLHSFIFRFTEGLFTFVSEPKPFQATLQEFSLNTKKLQLNICIVSEYSIDNLDVVFWLKRRSRPEIYNFFEQRKALAVGKVENGHIQFSLPIDFFSKEFLIDETNNIDPFIELRSKWTGSKLANVEVDSSVAGKIPQKFLLKEPYRTSLESYVTGSKRLSFYYRKELHNLVNLTTFKERLGVFSLGFEFQREISPIGFVLKRRDPKLSTFEYLEETVQPVTKKFRSYVVKLSQKTLYPLKTYEPDEKWDGFIRTSEGLDLPIFVPDSIEFEPKFELVNEGKYRARLMKNGMGDLTIRFVAAPTTKQEPKKLVVMGTCFSRNAFNTSPYFNPDYKSFFNVQFTQTHTSLISATTPAYAGEIPFDEYADTFTATEFGNVKDDFRKDFFQRLEAAQPDYFLIDLYPDAIRPIIWLDDKSAITGSYILEGSPLFDAIPCKEILDHSDDEAFYQIWKKHADEFLSKLMEIIPEERIILNKGGFTYKYYDENQKVANYQNKMAIQKAQLLWDRLNNYFLSVAPNVRVIDLSNKGYIGDFYYPFGHSFSHFESGYYKDFLKEMIYIDQTNSFRD